jgi:hypothetical protein
MPLITGILERIGAFYGIEAGFCGIPHDMRRAAQQNLTKLLVDLQ